MKCFHKRILHFLGIFLLVILGAGCSSDSNGPALFQKLSPDQTGVTFNNVITSSDSLNNYNYPFTYHGGGVGIGDINNDGLTDLYFTGNMRTSRLYLNKGNMQFVDITESAGVQTDRWVSGVSMVDINADGHLDIYVSAVSSEDESKEERTNLLFINNGDLTFTEAAAEYQLNTTNFTTQSAFLDYDRDGDLDVFQLNHSPGAFARNNAVRESFSPYAGTSFSYDELYRNEGDGTFERVSKEAGILRENGFGLGVAVSDLNNDGWPDIYVSNDVVTNDVLYINNGDGTFSDKTTDYLKHTSFAGMGVDVADFNNDGWADIYQTDMMPEDYIKRKKMSGGITYSHYLRMRAKGYNHQYSMNTLQISNGTTAAGHPQFSEIGRLAGVAYTDWSWSALFGDYDNDGLKDIMVTNGFPKAINNYDFLHGVNNMGRFGTEELKREKRRNLLKELHGYKVPNYFFRNEGDLTFEDKSQEWGFNEPGYSYGAAQSDLDNDGDLDLVINNLNEPAAIFRNRADTLTQNHWLSVSLKGSSENRHGIGARVIVRSESQKQHQWLSPYRGYQSSLDHRLLFGLGSDENVDTLEVIWPDHAYQQLTDLPVDSQIVLRHDEATGRWNPETYTNEGKLFREVTAESGIDHTHSENEYSEFEIQGLLPYQLSKLGPALAVADVNGDGREDFYVGGAADNSGRLYLQTTNGKFKQTSQSQPWHEDSQQEDVGATFFDADGDGDQDLYVTSGGYEFSPASELLQDRLYINDGEGQFIQNTEVLPQMLTSSGVVKAVDYDADGDQDLFVGGRQVPRRYPHAPRSYLLRNDGGNFSDVTSSVIPGAVEPGMITDAEWVDFNGDGQLDLVTAGEWLPIQFYQNNGETFEEVTAEIGNISQTGWWQSLASADMDGDGDQDLLAGNIGKNYTYRADGDQTFEVYADDFDGNQNIDLLFSVAMNGEHIPWYGRAKMGMKIEGINRKFPTFEQYAEASVEEVVGSRAKEDAMYLRATTFESIYLENRGPEGFEARSMPNETQISSISDFITRDFNGDGYHDILLAGNLYDSEPQTPRNDAGNGLLLKGDGEGGFIPVSPFNSGFVAPLDVKQMRLINIGGKLSILVVSNEGPVQLFARRSQ
ncbi:VCBS repeat-containing protein [Aliifodinibius sp. S!AR15-10]|uniref:VCBS repeat-containing protein n=1 Tax=Aliifodinibius sp. S!AR15-10 TaxID=2950437 RepID=UPI0028584CEC|nr:VCBS repeat-containing protein [Aliifodinibius sp. S!AR15-10]MDR8392422.1 VCBS repeat-containing protein [Aliifodinibius sp. S!AR15-10]